MQKYNKDLYESIGQIETYVWDQKPNIGTTIGAQAFNLEAMKTEVDDFAELET